MKGQGSCHHLQTSSSCYSKIITGVLYQFTVNQLFFMTTLFCNLLLINWFKVTKSHDQDANYLKNKILEMFEDWYVWRKRDLLKLYIFYNMNSLNKDCTSYIYPLLILEQQGFCELQKVEKISHMWIKVVLLASSDWSLLFCKHIHLLLLW